MHALSNLIHRSVDYAGLFPPAALGLEEVVSNYDQYFNSAQQSMLGRLIIPAMKLDAFEQVASELSPAPSEKERGWRISALVPPIDETDASSGAKKFKLAFNAINAFNTRRLSVSTESTRVDSVEIKTTSESTTVAIVQALPDGTDAFLEIDWRTDPDHLIQSIATHRSDKPVFAKIRTGGVTPELIPTSRQVARFIAACGHHNVGFKATAGLHHPIRSEYRLTYEPDAPVATLHGFLNVFLATAIAFEHHVPEETLVEILNTTQPDEFHFDNAGLRWRELLVSSERIREIREFGILSFGSCSFTEPTEELLQFPGATSASVFTC